ncbi:hypothetical protein [Bradyrhizobium canariense]|uniref:hypothetical protein n=1 Tax=Bradyrhizobium canariense TaxID=255045 RepID=UPI00142FAEB0|nr:hypothetical protein [Bradyrhizobium canariense]
MSRSLRYLDRAGPRYRCGGDHPAATLVIGRSKVAEKDNALTHDRDNQGYDHGYE